MPIKPKQTTRYTDLAEGEMRNTEDNAPINLKKKTQRRGVYVSQPNELWAVDLVDMTRGGKSNGYILNVVDAFTRKLFSTIIKQKTSGEINSGLQDAIKTLGGTPQRIWSDKEAGVVSASATKEWADKNHIELHYTEHSYKGHGVGIVESLNNTMKKYYKTITQKGVPMNTQQRMSKVVANFPNIYNNKWQSGVHNTPNEAGTAENFLETRHHMIKHFTKPRQESNEVIKVGDWVFVVRDLKDIHAKDVRKWSNTKFKVIKVKPTNPTTYELQGKKGTYYKYELHLTTAPKGVNNSRDADTEEEDTDVEK